MPPSPSPLVSGVLRPPPPPCCSASTRRPTLHLLLLFDLFSPAWRGRALLRSTPRCGSADMCPPVASPAGRALHPLPPRLLAAARVVVVLPVAATVPTQQPSPPRRLYLAAPTPTAEKGGEEMRWWRGAEEMDAAVRREIAIRRLQVEVEKAATKRSRREFAVFETATDPLRDLVIDDAVGSS